MESFGFARSAAPDPNPIRSFAAVTGKIAESARMGMGVAASKQLGKRGVGSLQPPLMVYFAHRGITVVWSNLERDSRERESEHKHDTQFVAAIALSIGTSWSKIQKRPRFNFTIWVKVFTVVLDTSRKARAKSLRSTSPNPKSSLLPNARGLPLE